MDIAAYLNEPQNFVFYFFVLPIDAVAWIFVYAQFSFTLFLLMLITTIILFISQFYHKKPRQPPAKPIIAEALINE